MRNTVIFHPSFVNWAYCRQMRRCPPLAAGPTNSCGRTTVTSSADSTLGQLPSRQVERRLLDCCSECPCFSLQLQTLWGVAIDVLVCNYVIYMWLFLCYVCYGAYWSCGQDVGFWIQFTPRLHQYIMSLNKTLSQHCFKPLSTDSTSTTISMQSTRKEHHRI